MGVRIWCEFFSFSDERWGKAGWLAGLLNLLLVFGSACVISTSAIIVGLRMRMAAASADEIKRATSGRVP